MGSRLKNRNSVRVFKPRYLTFFALPILILFFLSTKLRPISDDYCAGSVVTSHGFIGGVYNVYKVWSGDIFSSIVTYSMVGIPIRYLNFNFVSAIPFIFAFLPLTFFFYLNLKIPKNNAHSTSIRLASAIWLYISCYSAALISSITSKTSIFDQVNPDTALGISLSIVYWQNINTAYLIAPGMLVLFVYFVYFSNSKMNRFLKIGLSILLGLSIGTSGAWIFTTYLVFETFSYVYTKIKNYEYKYKVEKLVCVLFSAFGFYLSLNSPGTQNRRGSLSVTAMQDPNLLKITSWTMDGFFDYIFSILLSWSTLLAFILGFANGYVLKSFLRKIELESIRKLGSVFVIIGIVSVGVVTASEAFAYPAFWHLVGPAGFLWFGIHLLGMTANSSNRFNSAIHPAFVIGIGLIFISFIFILAERQVDSRLQKWNLGAAPISGIADIETPGGYIDQCWNNIKSKRVVPKRSLL